MRDSFEPGFGFGITDANLQIVSGGYYGLSVESALIAETKALSFAPSHASFVSIKINSVLFDCVELIHDLPEVHQEQSGGWMRRSLSLDKC